MRIIIYKYYNFLYFFLIFLKIIGFKINYINISNFAIFKSKHSEETLAEQLKKKDILPLPLEDLEKVDTISPFIHDLKKETYKANIDSVNDKIIKKSSKFFGDNIFLEKKLRVSLQKKFGDLFFHIKSKIDIWSNNNNEKIIYIIPFEGIVFNFNERVTKIILPFELVEFLHNTIKKIFILTFKKFYFYRQNKKNLKKNDNINYSKCFFLHYGRTSGSDLFQKKIYFNEDPNSENFIDNFLFIDYTNSLKSKKKNQYNIQDIPKKAFSNLISSLYFFFTLILSCRNISNICGVIILSHFFYNFKNFVDILSKFKNLKECYFANDITSPKELFLALDKKKIVSICHQERFMLSFCNTYPSNISNKYFCISNFIKKTLIKSNNYFADEIIPSGFWKVKENMKVKKNFLSEIEGNSLYEKKIIVLGQNAPHQWFISKSNPYNSWRAQINFLNDVLYLAEKNKNCLFVLRFKDDSWSKINAFEDMLSKLKLKKNIFISSENKVEHYSYLLCRDSDLVIGQYTSLIDECLSQKIPTLIIDYNHQTDSIISEGFNYEKPIIFCNSINELEDRMNNYFRGLDITVNTEKFFSL